MEEIIMATKLLVNIEILKRKVIFITSKIKIFFSLSNIIYHLIRLSYIHLLYLFRKFYEKNMI